MKIEVTLPGGKVTVVETMPEETVYSLKTKIQHKSGIPAPKQTIFYGDFTLRDNHCLGDYYIHRNSTIDVLVLFNIAVLLPNGQTVEMKADSDETVRSLKIRFARTFRFPIQTQIVKFRSEEMADYKCLGDYEIYDDVKLMIELKYEKLSSQSIDD